MPEGPTIVVCDDEQMIRWFISRHLEAEGFVVVGVPGGAECVAAVAEHAPACVVLDLGMPGMDGITALRCIRDAGNDVPVVVVTARGGVDSAIAATQLGAAAYLQKPFDMREISLAVRRALDQERLRREVHLLRDRQHQGYGEFIGRSPALQPLFTALERLEKVAVPTVLITGETGTGKDVVARMIHRRGPRATELFVDVNCASLPEQLIESELFGHERGAFTDAKTAKRGLLEAAGAGVVFLDEIGEMSLATQSKLLRALENRTFKRVGGLAALSFQATLIAATHRDLRKEVDQGRFREDMYYRLDVVKLRVPSLRERPEDVPLLAAHFVERFNREFGRSVEGITAEAVALMQAYAWPGNVRELKNTMERLVILGPQGMIGAADLPPEIRHTRAPAATAADDCPFRLPVGGVRLETVERSLVVQALERSTGNQSAAARLLGITRRQLRYRLEKFGLEEPESVDLEPN